MEKNQIGMGALLNNLDEKSSRIDIMNMNELKNLLDGFGKSVKFEQDLKKLV